ncbi:MAG: rhomboid family intramembrane serine protease, partial [Bacteroidales bacterium]|nr:rhomboid family intramembrane serine protease [Bacteroidales bacterium]
MALSLIVVFLYGSMVWGLYPQNTGISWEGHLAGAVTGLVCAFIYPIKKVVHDFDDEDDDDYDTTFEGSDIEIKYHYTSGKEKNE